MNLHTQKDIRLLPRNEEGFLINRCDIETWLKAYRINNYIIQDDLTVDIDGDISWRVGTQNRDMSHTEFKFYELFACEGVAPFKFGHIEGNFDCTWNVTESLKGSPDSVKGDFNCSHNRLESLRHSPQTVGGRFKCGYNWLESLTHGPRTVGDLFDCSYNPVKSIYGFTTKCARFYHEAPKDGEHKGQQIEEFRQYYSYDTILGIDWATLQEPLVKYDLKDALFAQLNEKKHEQKNKI